MGDDSDRPADLDKDVGIPCTECGCYDLRVFQTRSYLSVIVRIRVCRHCGKKVYTREILR